MNTHDLPTPRIHLKNPGHPELCEDIQSIMSLTFGHDQHKFELAGQLYASILPHLVEAGVELTTQGRRRISQTLRFWAGMETPYMLSLRDADKDSPLISSARGESACGLFIPVDWTITLARILSRDIKQLLASAHPPFAYDGIPLHALITRHAAELESWCTGRLGVLFEAVRGVSSTLHDGDEGYDKWAIGLAEHFSVVCQSMLWHNEPVLTEAITLQGLLYIHDSPLLSPVSAASLPLGQAPFRVGTLHQSGKGHLRVIEGYCFDAGSMMAKYIIRDVDSGEYMTKNPAKAHQEYTFQGTHSNVVGQTIPLPFIDPLSGAVLNPWSTVPNV